MRNILTIAKREARRFQSRFTGSSKMVVLLVLIAALVLSYFAFQQGIILGKDIYTVGVYPGSADIHDDRFNVIVVDRLTGHNMLYDGSIDVYVDGEYVIRRKDSRSQYAAGALMQYFEKEEITQIKDEYDIDRAFPLRIEVNHLNVTAGTAVSSVTPPVTTVPSGSTTVEPVIAPTAAPVVTKGPDVIPPVAGSSSDDAVREQIKQLESGSGGSGFKAEFVSDKEIIVPSLMNPPIPLSQIIIAFLYIVPIFFISIFFTSSFMEEKTNRKLNILMSSPVTPFDVIAGKLLPYFIFSLVVTIIVTVALKGNILLALAIFIPVILFIFSIYLMIALFYRTFKDQTFFSMTAITFVTGYLVFPALFTGVNDMSFISPLTLAVMMYRGESFGLVEYLFSTGPMYLIFLLTMFLSVRIFNEEYLMSYGPLYRKVADAIYLAIDKKRIFLSVMVLSMLLVPVVFMVQLVFVALSVNIPPQYILGIILILCVMVEEIAKSAGITMLIENKVIRSSKDVAILAFLSALGFLAGEKLLLYLSLSVISNVMLIEAIGSADLLIIPLIAHFMFTLMVCMIIRHFGVRYYPIAIIAGSSIHYIYNLAVLGMIP